MGTHKSPFCPLVLIREPEMLGELPMTGLVKLHRGIAIVDGRRLWAGSALRGITALAN